MWPEQNGARATFLFRMLSDVCPHAGRALGGRRVQPQPHASVENASPRALRGMPRDRRCHLHCATRISLSRTINLHGKPTSESGSRVTKLLVTMLTTSPRDAPDVIVHSSATPLSRCSAHRMNASYVPSLSVVISVASRRRARSSSDQHARVRESDDLGRSRATSGGCHARSVTNA